MSSSNSTYLGLLIGITVYHLVVFCRYFSMSTWMYVSYMFTDDKMSDYPKEDVYIALQAVITVSFIQWLICNVYATYITYL